VREICLRGSVRGAARKGRPYRDVELMARFSTPAAAGHVHVFAVAAGEVLASLAPVGVAYDDAASRRQKAYEEASIGRALHDESEADEDGFIAGAGFDRYGGFPGDGLS